MKEESEEIRSGRFQLIRNFEKTSNLSARENLKIYNDKYVQFLKNKVINLQNIVDSLLDEKINASY